MEGTISVQPQANDVEGFKEYFLGLNVKNNRRNPWFVGKSLKRYLEIGNNFLFFCRKKFNVSFVDEALIDFI